MCVCMYEYVATLTHNSMNPSNMELCFRQWASLIHIAAAVKL